MTTSKGMKPGQVTSKEQVRQSLIDTADRLAQFSPNAVGVLKAISERDEQMCIQYNIHRDKITPKDQLSAAEKLLRLVNAAQKNVQDYELQRQRLLTERSNARAAEAKLKSVPNVAQFQSVAKLRGAK